jgi:hypothetical protein
MPVNPAHLLPCFFCFFFFFLLKNLIGSVDRPRDEELLDLWQDAEQKVGTLENVIADLQKAHHMQSAVKTRNVQYVASGQMQSDSPSQGVFLNELQQCIAGEPAQDDCEPKSVVKPMQSIWQATRIVFSSENVDQLLISEERTGNMSAGTVNKPASILCTGDNLKAPPAISNCNPHAELDSLHRTSDEEFTSCPDPSILPARVQGAPAHGSCEPKSVVKTVESKGIWQTTRIVFLTENADQLLISKEHTGNMSVGTFNDPASIVCTGDKAPPAPSNWSPHAELDSLHYACASNEGFASYPAPPMLPSLESYEEAGLIDEPPIIRRLVLVSIESCDHSGSRTACLHCL